MRRKYYWLALVAAVVLVLSVKWPKATQPMGKASVFTKGPGAEIFPSFSPDGREVVYSGGASGSHLWIQTVGDGPVRQLTRAEAEDLCPVWSPDGTQIAFLRNRGEDWEYWLIPSAGGEEKKIAAAPNLDEAQLRPRLSWLRDSRTLVVAEEAGLFLLDTSTGAKKRLTSGKDRSPAASPDGKQVAFVHGGPDQKEDLYAVKVEGGEPRHLTFEGESIYGIAWTPDSRTLVYSARRMGEFRLWRISAYGGSPKQLLDAEPDARFPAIARTGHRMAYTKVFADRNLARLDLTTGRSRRWVASPLQDQSGQFSPDGKKIAFFSDRSGNMELWVCDADGQNPAQITKMGGGRMGSPRWSPDGRTIAFDYRKRERPSVYVIPAAGGELHRITAENGDSWGPSWSRDGAWVYFSQHGSVRRVKAGGGDDERVARGGERGVEGPDGKTVYFWSYPDNGLRQVRRGTEDQNQELPGMTRPSCPGCWAIVGNSIYYVDGNPETRSYVVKRYDLKSQRNTELKPLGSNVAWDPWSFAVSPDGKYVLYGQMDRGNTDLMLIEGFR